MKFRKMTIVSGLACLVAAAFGVMVLASQPALSKNDTKKQVDGVFTTLGF